MNRLSEQYQYLLAGKITGTLTRSEEAELEKLLADDNDIQLLYNEMADQLPGDWVNNNLAHLNHPEFWKKPSKFKPRNLSPVIKYFAAAAVTIGLIVGGWLWLDHKKTDQNVAINDSVNGVELKLANGKIIDLSRQQGKIIEGNTMLINNEKSLTYSDQNLVSSGVNTINVPYGKDYKITLSDGSVVWMNSVTTLEFPFQFTGNSREITITGEAYMEVVKESKKPFIVNLPNGSVKVLGTAFNVNTYDSGSIKVALVNGAVQMYAGDKTLSLKPGMQGTYNKTTGSISNRDFNAKSVLSWQKGLHYFEYADINEISSILKRWYNVHIMVDNPSLNQKRIKGVLNKNKPIEIFLDDIKFVAKIDSYYDKDGVLHFR